jgi:hypothetical protein
MLSRDMAKLPAGARNVSVAALISMQIDARRLV